MADFIIFGPNRCYLSNLEASTKKCGLKRISVDIEKVCDVPLAKRSTLQSLAFALGISKTTLIKFVKDEILLRNSNALKPYIKDGYMKDRLRFCLSMLEETSIPHDPVLKSMYNVVHMNEKWFYMTIKYPFSGKIGMFPLVHKVAAKRSSIGRASGTLETKPITFITKKVSRMFLIENVLMTLSSCIKLKVLFAPIIISF
jgi:hypothetical protein